MASERESLILSGDRLLQWRREWGQEAVLRTFPDISWGRHPYVRSQKLTPEVTLSGIVSSSTFSFFAIKKKNNTTFPWKFLVSCNDNLIKTLLYELNWHFILPWDLYAPQKHQEKSLEHSCISQHLLIVVLNAWDPSAIHVPVLLCVCFTNLSGRAHWRTFSSKQLFWWECSGN